MSAEPLPGGGRRPPRPPLTGISADPEWGIKLYVVIRGDDVIGWTSLEVPIEGGRAAGVFVPGPQYSRVRPVFDLYRNAGSDAAALRHFIEERDALLLSLYERSDLPLAAVVEHISEGKSRSTIHVRISDERYWIRFPEFRWWGWRPRFT